VIRLELEGSPTAAERWAFELLVDLCRLLPVDPASTGGVTARLTDAAPGRPDFIPGAGSVQVDRAALRRVVDIAGAAQEQRVSSRDRHGRVPASANPLVQTGRERQLPLHETAEQFFRAVRTAAGDRQMARLGSWPHGHRWAAAFTHDVDVVRGWPLFALLRWSELLRRGEFGRAASAVGSAWRAIGSRPVQQGVEAILALEREAGVRATWFVLAGIPTFGSWRRGDVTYRLDAPETRRLLELVLSAGHEIGLHGSLETRDSAQLMAEERERVARVTGKIPDGVRQHFLRLDPGHTLAGAARAGFRYDASFGFAERNGFRLGLADVIPLWQESAGRPLPLLEVPLCWMDRTLSKYQRQEDPERWVDDAVELAASCRDVGGLWVGLWHPNVIPALGFPGALAAFGQLLRRIMDDDPYVAPLAEIVTWRAARRGLRGRVGEEGRVELVGDRRGSWRVALEELPSGQISSHPWPEPARA
jgi:peptidoglycan/xylan/chitin deacetylase (PgdA/CDA1 family)